MDPITTAVLAAVVKLADPVVRDGYDALKSLIARKFGNDSQLATAVQQLEAKPESEARKAVVQEEVATAGADRDAEILSVAQALLEQVKTAHGDQVVNQAVQGDRNIFSGTGDVTVNLSGL